MCTSGDTQYETSFMYKHKKPCDNTAHVQRNHPFQLCWWVEKRERERERERQRERERERERQRERDRLPRSRSSAVVQVQMPAADLVACVM